MKFGAYPTSRAELEKWLTRYTIPGKTRPQDVTAIFGRPHGTHHGKYYYAVYGLHALGVSGFYFDDAELTFQFDDQSGRLIGACIREGER